LSNIDYTKSIIWKRYSLSHDGGIPHVIIDERETDVQLLDDIPYKHKPSLIEDSYYVIPSVSKSSGVQFYDVHAKSQIEQCPAALELYKKGYYAALSVITQMYMNYKKTDPSSYYPLICHPNKASIITDSDPTP
jgi:hypothetical protein